MFGIEDFSKPIIDFSDFHFSQIGDAVVFGAAILLIGMVTVFAVLCILWLFMVLFKFVFHDLADRRKAKRLVSASNVTEAGSDTEFTDDDEIIAVIAAAITAAESENTDMKFRVVSFRRT